MTNLNKYASDGRKYDIYNPRPESHSHYLYAFSWTGWPRKPYNVGKNKAKKIAFASRSRLLIKG